MYISVSFAISAVSMLKDIAKFTTCLWVGTIRNIALRIVLSLDLALAISIPCLYYIVVTILRGGGNRLHMMELYEWR